MPLASTYWILYAGVLLLAVNGLFAKELPLDAVSITHLRSVIAAIAIAVTLLVLKRRLMISHKKTLIGVYFLGVLMGLHWVTFFHAMQVSTIAIGMLSLYTFPVITVMMEAAVHKKKPHLRDVVSAMLLLAGIVVMISDKPFELSSNAIQGVLWGVLSAFLFASRNILQKYCFAGVSSDKLMLHQMLAIILMLFLFIDTPSISALSNSHWLAIFLLGILTTAGAHTLLVISYKRLPAKTVAMISCLQPVLAALLGWIFIKDELTLAVVLGGTIILSVALFESAMSGNKSSDRRQPGKV